MVKRNDFPDMNSFMKYVREQKKSKQGKGIFGDALKGGLKFVKNEALNRAPLPQFLKEPVSGLADKGIDMAVSITGLGLKKRGRKPKGGALNLP
jgi:hypothetical protein